MAPIFRVKESGEVLAKDGEIYTIKFNLSGRAEPLWRQAFEQIVRTLQPGQEHRIKLGMKAVIFRAEESNIEVALDNIDRAILKANEADLQPSEQEEPTSEHERSTEAQDALDIQRVHEWLKTL